jgi:hypothetical protein
MPAPTTPYPSRCRADGYPQKLPPTRRPRGRHLPHPLASTLLENIKESKSEGDLIAFAEHTVLSLIAFAILVDASLLIAILGR